MTKIEAFRLAIAELGESNAQELSDHIRMKYGLLIPLEYIPVFRATLRSQFAVRVNVALGSERKATSPATPLA